MQDSWTESQWQTLCEQLQLCVDHLGSKMPDRADEFAKQAAEFSNQPPPDRYPDLLQRVREATHLALEWKGEAPPEKEASPTGGSAS